MDVERFLEEHGLTENPFGAEEARHDPVFEKIAAGEGMSHPELVKVLGSPDRPHTSVESRDLHEGFRPDSRTLREVAGSSCARLHGGALQLQRRRRTMHRVRRRGSHRDRHAVPRAGRSYV